jgi:phospholipid/cholesterol/gamma-HCH transport system substrate-binding protein
MESSLSSQVKVGFFVLMGVCLLLATVIFLGGDKLVFRDNYTLYMHLNSVQGINTGSVVALSGMNVGNVGEIRFLPDAEQVELELIIEKKFQKRITKDAVASVKTQGALGDKYIFIKQGPLGGEVLKDKELVVADDGGDLFDTLAKKGNDLSNVIEVVNELHTLLKNMNADGRSAKLMSNLVLATDSLNKTLKEVQGLSADLRGGNEQQSHLKKSMSHLASVLEKVDTGEGSLGALINDRGLYDRLMQMVGGSSRSQNMKSIIRDTIKKSEHSK